VIAITRFSQPIHAFLTAPIIPTDKLTCAERSRCCGRAGLTMNGDAKRRRIIGILALWAVWALIVILGYWFLFLS
jgi:predicted nucleic acid-binding Zn ribbon protein